MRGRSRCPKESAGLGSRRRGANAGKLAFLRVERGVRRGGELGTVLSENWPTDNPEPMLEGDSWGRRVKRGRRREGDTGWYGEGDKSDKEDGLGQGAEGGICEGDESGEGFGRGMEGAKRQRRPWDSAVGGAGQASHKLGKWRFRSCQGLDGCQLSRPRPELTGTTPFCDPPTFPWGSGQRIGCRVCTVTQGCEVQKRAWLDGWMGCGLCGCKERRWRSVLG